MSVLSVVKDVCLNIGVNPPTSMFTASVQQRTQAELLSLANEMAQRIAYDAREWTELKAIQTFNGDGVKTNFPLPENYQRMLLSSQVYPSWSPRQPMRFIADSDEWLVRRLNNEGSPNSEWTLLGGEMRIHPAMAVGQSASFLYLDKNCVKLNAGGFGDQFQNDLDSYRLSERLLKLGMIWQWKANKGSPYAEDMGTYTDAFMLLAGSNQPAPIIVDKAPISHAAQIALPWPVGWGNPA